MLSKYFFIKDINEIEKFDGQKVIVIGKTTGKNLLENKLEIVSSKEIEENLQIRVFGTYTNGKIYADVVQEIKDIEINLFKDISNKYYEASN